MTIGHRGEGNLLSHFSANLGVQVSLSFRPLVALEGLKKKHEAIVITKTESIVNLYEVNIQSASIMKTTLREHCETLPVEVILGTSSVEEERAAPAPSMQQGVQSSMTLYLTKRIGVNQKKIDGQLQLFTKDFQPFSVVEDSGFCAGP
ncbi:uncharacterized protein LOC126267587 [Schistocerca gregaria]|uniref:uncharacterized protein LOC126267587 n=1 Tax=Schistocerca gregaria TaxID=7010 RepID=UPI00211DB7DF|nr:uncharacterized protein LOC126267587 [Schistocerca gregaria]